MRFLNKKVLIILLAALIPPIVFAVNITVPAAPGSGYFLYSTTTGAYVYHSSSTAATDFGITSSQWTTTSTGIYYNGGRVGIGTASPDHALTVSGNGHFTQGIMVDNLFVTSSYFMGNVGIGTSSPATTLDVNGSSTIRGNQYYPALGSSGALVLTTNGLVATSTYGTMMAQNVPASGIVTSNGSAISSTAIPLSAANGGTATTTALGSNAFNSTPIPTNYVSSINSATGTYAIVAGTNVTISTSSTSTTINSSGGATPAGTSTDVQFNNNGALGADTGNFTYTSSTATLQLTPINSQVRIGNGFNSSTSSLLTYYYRGNGTSTLIIPNGVSSITVVAVGAGGGTGQNQGSYSGASGGVGGIATGTISVTAGQEYYFVIGGMGSAPTGGYNGGGTGGNQGGYAGGGGGMTWFGSSTTISTSTTIIAAGGGGGGGNASTNGSGAKGGDAGSNGQGGSTPASAGSSIAGGNRGCGSGSNYCGTNGTLITGGTGNSGNGYAAGGGGGGGIYAGGGGGGGFPGGGAGGGGGNLAFFANTVTGTSTATSSSVANGYLLIYLNPSLSLPNYSINTALAVGGHIVTGGTVPTISNCGNSPSVIGTDEAGIITTGTGTVNSCMLNFANPYLTTPSCVFTNSTTTTIYIGNLGNSNYTINFSTSTPSTKVVYNCIN